MYAVLTMRELYMHTYRVPKGCTVPLPLDHRTRFSYQIGRSTLDWMYFFTGVVGNRCSVACVEGVTICAVTVPTTGSYVYIN